MTEKRTDVPGITQEIRYFVGKAGYISEKRHTGGGDAFMDGFHLLSFFFRLHSNEKVWNICGNCLKNGGDGV